MDKTGKRKIPDRLMRIANRCKGGERLCRYLHRKPSGEGEERFFFEPSGHRCASKSARDAIACGLLRPVGDGLLGDDQSSQTYVAA